LQAQSKPVDAGIKRKTDDNVNESHLLKKNSSLEHISKTDATQEPISLPTSSLEFPPSTGSAVTDEALQGMLMAWYYSGYATGRYQALKEVEEAAAATAAAAKAKTAEAEPTTEKQVLD
jgi:hypothetical protein